jgi:hypothetical protein
VANEEMNVQGFVHSLEQGKIAGFFRLVLSPVAVIALALAYLLLQFRGLSTPTGMDQAQIAHEITRGNGFSTKNIRPLEVHLQQTFGQAPTGNLPDFYHAPLNPIVSAGALYLLASQLHQKVDNGDPVYRGDGLIAAVSSRSFSGCVGAMSPNHSLDFWSNIVFGEYRDWASIVIGLPQGLNDFPLKSTVGLMNNQCLLLMDRTR